MEFGPNFLKEMRLMAVFAVAAVILYIVVQFTDMPSSVVDGYFPYADAMMHGVFPYTDKVFVYDDWNVWEYPPLAYCLMIIPRIFTSSTAGYQAVYLVLVLVFLWIGLHSTGEIAEIRGYSRSRAYLVYTLTMMLMAEFVFDRYDVFPVVLCILAVQFFLQKRIPLTAVMIGLGILLKLYPVLLLPVFLIWLLRERRYRDISCAAVSLVIVMCVAVPFVLIGDISQMFGYHSSRPMEIESLAASVLEVWRLIDPACGMSVIYSYGSDNLVGGISDSVSPYLTYVMLLVIVVVWLLYVLRSGSDRNLESRSFAVMFLTVSAFMLFGAIFSAQYVMWLIPFLLVLLMMEPSAELRKTYFWLFVVIEVLTQLNFLFNFGMRPDDFLSPWGVGSILLRNILLLFMSGIVLKRSLAATD